jgi:hypothetical protein
MAIAGNIPNFVAVTRFVEAGGSEAIRGFSRSGALICDRNLIGNYRNR